MVSLKSRTKNRKSTASLASVAEEILKGLPNQHKIINDLMHDGYQVVGYCQKSAIESKKPNWLSAKKMVDVTYSCSLVDKVFV